MAKIMSRMRRASSLLVGALLIVSGLAVLAPNESVLAADPAYCGVTITASTTLTHDIICVVFPPSSGSKAITIGANGITFDCAGHSITRISTPATVSNPGTGIDVPSVSGVTVKNCIVKNFGEGFRLESSGSSNTLTSDSAVGNINVGFHVFGSSNTLTSDSAVGTIVPFNWGFSVAGSSNTLVGNTASSYFVGFGVGGTFNSLASNTASGNNIGFLLGGELPSIAFSNTLTNNVASGNIEWGFLVKPGGDGNTLGMNMANSNGGPGFAVLGSSNTLVSNTANGNSVGFALGSVLGCTDCSTLNTLTGNTASGNTNDGFQVAGGAYSAFGNTLSINAANTNIGFGFHDGTSGLGTAGTANFYSGNSCNGLNNGGGAQSGPPGLC